MIISEDQARLVAKCLREGAETPDTVKRCEVDSDVIEAVRAAALSAPEVRTDRVEHAVVWLHEGELDSRLIAEKMMCRIMSDWLR
jgi:hypothetical protein